MTCKLSDLVIHQIGGGWGEESSKDGFKRVAVIRGTDIPRIKDGDFSSVPFRYEKQSKIPQRLLQPGDLIIEVSGGSAASGQHTGRALHITKEILSRLGGEVIPASFCKLIRLDQKEAVSGYCSYFIDLMHITKEIAVFENQSTGISNFQTSKFLEATELPLSFEAQKAVSEFLSKVDGLRLHLRYQNTALEAIAQRLFRSWFVNFDPVHAKAAGKEPEAMSAELAAFFPSEFEDSELGPIPKGWCAGSLHDVSLLNPEAWASRNHPAEVFYIDLSGVKKNVFSEVTRYTFDEAPSRARRVLRKGDSLYGTVRPGNLSYGYIGANIEGLTGSTGFAVLRPKAAVNAEFVYCAMTLKENIERLVLLAEGAAYPAVRPEIVHAQKVALPGNSLMTAFHDVTRNLFEQHALNQALIARLGELRDHLLPRLISGKLSLEEAEQAVEEATAA